MNKSVAASGLAGLGVVGLVLGLTAGVASAHVTIAEPEHVAGQYTLLTFGVPHGCDASPTTEVRIQIPEPIAQVTPTVNPGWDVAKVMETLDEPIEAGHGVQLTERVAEVVYTAHTPLPADLRDAFELSLQAPDLPGETLYFPTVQTCVEGETAWVELPADGVEEAELEHPSPKIELIAADAPTAGADTPAVGGATPEAVVAESQNATATSTDDDDSDGSSALSVVALVVGGVGVALGGASLAMRRKPA